MLLETEDGNRYIYMSTGDHKIPVGAGAGLGLRSTGPRREHPMGTPGGGELSEGYICMGKYGSMSLHEKWYKEFSGGT